MLMRSRDIHEHLARLEAAAQGAGQALACPHQTAEEFHRALIGDYLRSHAFRQLAGFADGIFVFAALLILA